MAEMENHFTVFIRLPFNRGDFVDPPPVAWSAAKERALWDVISRQGQGKGNEIDWHALATQFEVTQPFILQQAAWLYERQLSQVRAQLRKVGARQSATPSPAPGSMNSSLVGGQPMKRAGSGGSRVPSRLSTQHVGSPSLGGEGSTPPTPAKSRISLPLRPASGSTQPTQVRAGSTSSRPLSRQPSKEDNPALHSHSRRGSTQQQPLSRSPGQAKLQVQGSDSEDEASQSRFTGRRANPSSTHRRTPSLRKEIHTQSPRPDLEEDDDAPNFLPFAADATNANPPRQTPTSPQDPGATLRGGFAANPRPSTHRRSTSERIISPTKPSTITEQTIRPAQTHQNISSSGSSLSNSQPNPHAPRPPAPSSNRPSSTTATTLSPRQQASLRPSHRHHNSESSASMGSSFSDLDDASITQSALEEALMSNLGNTVTTNTVASRVSGIGQALGMGLRGRYFEGRTGQEARQGGGGGGATQIGGGEGAGGGER